MKAGSESRAVALASAIAGAILLVLAINLPAHTFVAGDSGVKLIAARNAIAHPSRPFDIDLPSIGGRPVPYLERFFAVHDDHAHALQSPIFPVIAAPLIAAFGLRGAYVLPLAAFIAMVPLLNGLRRRIDPAIPATTLLAIAVLANPIFFYALEFWEHVPATASVTAAMLIVLTRPQSTWTLAAGSMAALAVLLRPEAIWLAAALASVIRPWQRTSPFAFGLALVLLPFALYNIAEYGTFAGPHAAANLAPLTEGWVQDRASYLREWLTVSSPLIWVAVAIAAAGWTARRTQTDLRITQLVVIIPVAGMALAAAAGTFPHESLWHAWPLAFLLAVPTARPPALLWYLLAVSTIGIIVSAPHSGGSQWGPRFILIAAPVLMLLAAVVAADLLKPGFAQRVRVALLIVVLLAGLWTTRAAYRDLRGSKGTYAEIVAAFEALAPPGAYVVTSVWSLDQIMASLYGTRTFLYAADARGASGILQELAAARAERTVIVWPNDAATGESLAPVFSAGCQRQGPERPLPVVGWNTATAVCAGRTLQ